MLLPQVGVQEHQAAPQVAVDQGQVRAAVSQVLLAEGQVQAASGWVQAAAGEVLAAAGQVQAAEAGLQAAVAAVGQVRVQQTTVVQVEAEQRGSQQLVPVFVLRLQAHSHSELQ